jgi:1-acyl-sn-glycerol-3-phosphate acyltransferase
LLPIKFWPRVIFAATGIFFDTLVMGPIIVASGYLSTGFRTYKLTRFWAGVASAFMGITVSIRGAENVTPNTSYIITPNHQSHSDILALLKVLPTPFRWVIKRELLKIPVFGQALAATGAIAVNRADRNSSVQSLKEGSKKLTGGWSVLIYPEGTRSPDGNIQEFKKGAFMMAVQTGIPILPVTCNGAAKILRKKTLALSPGHISITIGRPIVTTGMTEQDVPELMERTKAEMLSNFDPDYDPFKRAS